MTLKRYRTRTTTEALVASTLVATLVGGTAAPAWAWDTPEHIRFGNIISTPFEQELLEAPVPVLTTPQGPKTFGDWVSAPDFGRGLMNFLNAEPVRGDLACSTLWDGGGATVGGQEIHDQSLADQEDGALGADPLEKRALIDCVNLWRINNNHFGDFAANQYTAYHKLAIEAARRYRSTRNAQCRAAAYTLEGWAQHHLTDSTAAGHAWNPPGTYDNTSALGFITWTGPGIRMRIHDFLNHNGALMGEPFFSTGKFWGDHSDENSGTGVGIPDAQNSPQRALTLKLAQMGLGQVVAAAECGGTPDFGGVLTTRDPVRDPRRVFASNQTMCEAMFGKEILRLVPDSVNIFGLKHPVLRTIVKACQDDRGDLTTNEAGIELAAIYFVDRFTRGNSDGTTISPTLDPESVLTLEELGCPATAPAAAAAAPQDSCGNAVCQTPADGEGKCGPGLVKSAGCCYAKPTDLGGAGDAEILPWTQVTEASGIFPLTTPSPVPGDDTAFLWFSDNGATAPVGTAWQPMAQSAPQALAGIAAPIASCGAEGSFSVFETRIKLPRTDALVEKVAVLKVRNMDEGLKVLVNGQLVTHRNRTHGTGANGQFGGLVIPLVRNATPALADGTYAVRLVHLNDCGDARPLDVQVVLDDAKNHAKSDGGDPHGDEGIGCAAGGRGGPLAGTIFLLGFAGIGLTLVRRRRRR
jgi:hypothetical protein